MKQQENSLFRNLRTTLTNQKKKLAYLAIVTLVTFFSLQLFAAGLPVGTDLLLLTVESAFIKQHSLWFSIWLPLGSFGYPIFFGTQFNFVLLLFSSIPDAVLATKLYVYAVFLLAGFSMYFFSYHYTNHYAASSLAAIVFVFNPVFLQEVYGGHHTIIFGYALAPLVFLTYDKAIITGKMRDIIVSAALLTTLFIVGHPQTTYIFGSFLLLFTFFQFPSPWSKKRRLDSLKRVTLVSTFTIVLWILLSAYEILPAIFNAGYSSVLFSLGYTIEDAYAYSSEAYYALLAALPLLVLLIVFLRGHRYAFFFSASALISSIISMGPYPPFGTLFIWAFIHAPLFNIFRVPYRFSMMTALSTSFLIGFIFAKESSRQARANFGSIQDKGKCPILAFRSSKRVLAVLAFAGIIVSSGLYVGYGAFGFPLSTFTFPDSYFHTYDWISHQSGDFKVLTVPYPAHYVNTTLMNGANKGWVWDPPVYGQAIHGKVVVTGYGGTTDTQDFLNFLGNQILYNRTDDLMKLLGTFNVKYVTVHPYPFRDEPELTESMKMFFTFQKGLTAVYQSDNITVLENDYWAPHIFAAENYGLVIGGRDVLMSLQKVDTFNLSRWVLAFANQLDNGMFNQLLKNANIVVLSDDGFRDLVMMSVTAGVRINAVQYGFPSSNPSKYWIPSKWWMNEGKLLINGASLRTKASIGLDVPFNLGSKGEYSVFIRVAFAPDRGRLSVLMNKSTLTSFVPYADAFAGFKWLNVGSVSLDDGENILGLENDGSGFNDIDEIAILPNGEFESKIDEVKNAIEASPARVIQVLEAEDIFTYQHQQDWFIKPNFDASNGYALVYGRNQRSTQLSGEIFVPRSGEYVLEARVLAGVSGSIYLYVDQVQQFTIRSFGLGSGWQWVSLGPIYLASGRHKISLEGFSESHLDELIFYSVNEPISLNGVFETQSQTCLDYKQVNAYKFNVNVKAANPFFIVFSESYHPLWKAYINGVAISALPAYSFVNAFYIAKPGTYEVTIEFIGQNYVVYGGLISIATIIGLVVYATFYRKIDSFVAKKLRKSPQVKRTLTKRVSIVVRGQRRPNIDLAPAFTT